MYRSKLLPPEVGCCQGGMWRKISCKGIDLQLSGTLNGGQSFRWRKCGAEQEDSWVGVFGGLVWFIRKDKDWLMYKVYGKTPLDYAKSKAKKSRKEAVPINEPNMKRYDDQLRAYFRFNVDLSAWYKKWSKEDPNFKLAAEKFHGIRMLDQEPIENIFSFICSSNNNIQRITSLVDKLCRMYGDAICSIEAVDYFTFPTPEQLCQPNVEESLRKAGFGYRAKYISQSAQEICKFGTAAWFAELQSMDYLHAKKELMNLPGIGPKVADCICLMSLGHLQAIPVDTHIYHIAQAVYLPHLKKNKTVTDAVYREISQHFQDLYGSLAGWAHTVLFCADLKKLVKHENAAK